MGRARAVYGAASEGGGRAESNDGERGSTTLADIATLQHLTGRLKAYGSNPALVKVDRISVDTMSYAQLADGLQRVAEDLLAYDVERGEPVGLVGPNGSAWVVACLGILAAGAAVMPIDARLSEPEQRAMVAGSGSRLLYARGAVEGDLSLRVIRERPDREPAVAADRVPPAASPQDLALLLHTSGTTATPKAVPLTHANVLSNVRAIADVLALRREERALLPLPLHHAYPLVLGLLLPLGCGASVVLPSGISGPELSRALQVGGANWLVGVPRLYEAMVSAITDRVSARGKVAARAFDRLTALSAQLARRGNRSFGRIVFARVRRTIAPGLQRLASGGAALDPATERTLAALGYEVLVGYGLTETAPILSFDRPGRAIVGSAGQAVPGVELRIAQPGADGIGEIEARGPNIFAGYRGDPETTRAAFTADGWFRTRDLGRIDGRGYLYLHGRAAETLTLPGGEKLDPEDIEAGYKNSMADELAILLEDEKLVALVVPSALARTGRDPAGVESAVRDALSECARKLRRYMQLTGFALTGAPLPRTELGKLRRHLLPALYRAAQAEMKRGAVEAAELSSADRALFGEPTAQRVWSWLKARYPDQRLSLDMSPQLDLGIDSLGWVSLTLELERTLGIALDEPALEHVTTLRELLEAAVAAKPEPALDLLVSQWLGRPSAFARIVYVAGHALNRALIGSSFPLRVEGGEHLPQRGPYVLCPNHSSYLDAQVLAAALPWPVLRQLYWVGAADVMFSAAWKRLFSRLARVLPIDPAHGARAGLELSVAALRRGRILVWFPEGWLSRDGTLQPFLPGIGALMLRDAVPIVPVHIDGTFAALPQGRRFPRRHRLTVRFGPPLDPLQWAAFTTETGAEESIASAIKAAVAALAGVPAPADER